MKIEARLIIFSALICLAASNAKADCTALMRGSTPADGFIDSRFDGGTGTPLGISEIVLHFEERTADIGPECISITETGSAMPPSFTLTSEGTDLRVTLSRPVTPDQWTSVTYKQKDPGKAHHVDVAQLFGDITGEGFLTNSDISSFVACFDGNASCNPAQVDLNRDGINSAADVLMLIEVNKRIPKRLAAKPHDGTDAKIKGVICQSNDSLIMKSLRELIKLKLGSISGASRPVVNIKRVKKAKSKPEITFASRAISPLKIGVERVTNKLLVDGGSPLPLLCEREHSYRVTAKVKVNGSEIDNSFDLTLMVPGMYQ